MTSAVAHKCELLITIVYIRVFVDVKNHSRLTEVTMASICLLLRLFYHDIKISDSKMKWVYLTQRKCIHIGNQKSEGHEPLLNIG